MKKIFYYLNKNLMKISEKLKESMNQPEMLTKTWLKLMTKNWAKLKKKMKWKGNTWFNRI